MSDDIFSVLHIGIPTKIERPEVSVTDTTRGAQNLASQQNGYVQQQNVFETSYQKQVARYVSTIPWSGEQTFNCMTTR